MRFRDEVYSVKSFSLQFSQGWYGGTSRFGVMSNKKTARIGHHDFTVVVVKDSTTIECRIATETEYQRVKSEGLEMVENR